MHLSRQGRKSSSGAAVLAKRAGVLCKRRSMRKWSADVKPALPELSSILSIGSRCAQPAPQKHMP
ncbi:hypothetical protein FH972_023216 [Carpinus fangiana]|uniref:Uncharacterized protein n=1 Tax=Carpinus fangiana TaxID=176857 RepID=A0A5N6KUK1_9ROSI|nr:hypothetical protein FH972_023216 [Carpinus fangiana]